MKVLGPVVVFDRGGLMESESWVWIREAISSAVQKIACPAGDDRLLIRNKVPKGHTQGRPCKRQVRVGLTSARSQFLAGLAQAVREGGMTEDLECGLGRLARAGGALLMVEYPSRRPVSIQDEDFGAFLRYAAGNFDAYFERGTRSRCAVKLELGREQDANFTMNKFADFVRGDLVDCGVLVFATSRLSEQLGGCVMTWEQAGPWLSVWSKIGCTLRRGALAVLGIEHND